MSGDLLLQQPSWVSASRRLPEIIPTLYYKYHSTKCSLLTAITAAQIMQLPSPCTLPFPIFTRGTHMWECYLLTTTQRLIPLCPLSFWWNSWLWVWTVHCAAGYWTPCQADVKSYYRTKYYLLFTDPQQGSSPGLRPQPTSVLPLHPWLHGHRHFQCHQYICRWHSSVRSDHEWWRDGLQRKSELPNKLVPKTKEIIVDFRWQNREHSPITINGTPIEMVKSCKFLAVHISDDLT